MPTPIKARSALLLLSGLAALPLGGAHRQPAPSQPPPPPADATPQTPAKGPEQSPEKSPAPPSPSKTPVRKDEPEVILHLVDGRRFSGFLVEKNALEIIIRIAGIKTPFKVEAVDRYEILPPVLERYTELRKTIDDEDVDALLRLCEWLVARQQLDTALLELDALLKRQPTSGPVMRQRQLVLKQIDLRDKSRTRPIDGAPSAPPAGVDGSDAARPSSRPDDGRQGLRSGTLFEPFPYLSPDDINLIKVYEVDLAKPPRLEIPREVITSLLDRFNGHPALPTGREGREAVYRLSPREQLDLLFRVRARDLYPQVRVLEQPESLRVFRDDVQRTWLLNSCATAACHGGSEAGRLILAAKRPSSDAVVSTNFYILSQFRTSDGAPLLDFENPEKSPLIQAALPREEAVFKHPAVLRGGEARDAWKPTFRSRDDRRYQQAIAWIRMLYQPRPQYGIKYAPARPFTPSDPKASPGGR